MSCILGESDWLVGLVRLVFWTFGFEGTLVIFIRAFWGSRRNRKRK